MEGMIRAWRARRPRDRRFSREIQHGIFCASDTGEPLEECTARRPGSRHDKWDGRRTHRFCVTYDGRGVASVRLVPGARPSRFRRFAPWRAAQPSMPTIPILAKLGLELTEDEARFAEPSRFGLIPELRGTEPGRQSLLALVGVVVLDSLASGYDYWLLTFREPLFWALHWIPWEILGEPFLYPPEKGGPRTEEPILAAKVNVHQIIARAGSLSEHDQRRLFPGGLPAYDRTQAGPIEALDERAAANWQRMSALRRDRRANTLWLRSIG